MEVNKANSQLIESNLDASIIYVCEENLNQNKEMLEQVDEMSEENIQTEIGNINGIKFCNDSLKVEIDPVNLFDWKIVNLRSNIQLIFDKFKNSMFASRLAEEKYKVIWDGFELNGLSFQIFEDRKLILISENNLIRPRIQQISVIVHALIHLYLYKCSDGKIKMNHHDNNFREIMHYFNDNMKTTVTTCHNFSFTPEEENYANHWWCCTGACQSYEPFHGIIRSKIVPSKILKIWDSHENVCSGSYFKIFEFHRKNSQGDIKKKYFRNAKFMNPTPTIEIQHKDDRTKNLQIREEIDLTDELQEAPKVKNLCDYIDLDETQYCDDDNENTLIEAEYYVEFLTQLNANWADKCPICEEKCNVDQFMSHFDFCTIFPQNDD